MPLTELRDVAQEPGEARRRWFRGDEIELVVWQDAEGVRMYQLRYRIEDDDFVVEWRRATGLRHYSLDDGDTRSARVKPSPVLDPIHAGDVAAARAAFDLEAGPLDPGIRDTIERTLTPEPDPGGPGAW